MLKARDLIGKEVVNQATGERLAQVSDLILDRDARRIVALLVDGGGWFGDAKVMRWSNVVSIGDVIIAHGDNPVIIARDDAEVSDLINQDTRITGTTIISDGGERIGTVGDVYIDDAGEVVGYEVSQGLMNDWSGRKFLTADQVQAVGKDAIIANTSDLKSVEQATQPTNERQDEPPPGAL